MTAPPAKICRTSPSARGHHRAELRRRGPGRPTSSKNYSSWKDIVALYDDLDHRIDAICDAWEISLKYTKPANHKNEIVAPLSRDNVAGTNDNKYRLDFEERYPGAKPVEVN